LGLPLLSQPVLIIGLKHGKLSGMAIFAATAVILGLSQGLDFSLGYLTMAAIAPLLLFLLGRGFSSEVMVGGIAGFLVVVPTLVLISLFGSLAELYETARVHLLANLEISLRTYEKLGYANEGVKLLKDNLPQMVSLLVEIIPALVFAWLAASVLFNLALLYRRFPKARGTLLPEKDLKEWKTADVLVWLFILSGFGLFLPAEWGLQPLAFNLFLGSLVFYFFQGLAIIAYYFHHKKIPLFLRGLGYVLIALEQVLTILVVGMGLFDLWGDFRGLNRKNLNPT